MTKGEYVIVAFLCFLIADVGIGSPMHGDDEMHHLAYTVIGVVLLVWGTFVERRRTGGDRRGEPLSITVETSCGAPFGGGDDPRRMH